MKIKSKDRDNDIIVNFDNLTKTLELISGPYNKEKFYLLLTKDQVLQLLSTLNGLDIYE